ncbi:MAG TPA: SUMF1/EgtB/PvdO family nonheme iron enzyme [Verrucomicrobiota bacterium]|nr:SUMF1/EgtB/PvdO family nonheme iron enzyme [Verrucomicrobiota bacterium]HQE89721.1 SUMF1/EgtB/PvdO family nonheme iron enzyme [Verrucomicrobiota bacterium]HQH02263.1 SUMF1/EgtB/PvdO family nonheme iron enzyme [Verrucomicrobiota bacterium]HRY58797.1 SUMF1/EgtB/PvdO family nonheme iron enzyme [Candidatus Paceibacterota bacterium]
MTCPQCHSQAADDARFCPGCGAPLPAPGAGEAPSIGAQPTARSASTLGRWKMGEKVLERYRIVGELGQGGMGVVYKCFEEVGGIEVALKALPPELSHNTVEMEEVRENFQLVERLHHPNITAVKTLERDERTGDYYLILELAEGVDLRRWRKQRGGRVPLPEVLPILRQVAAALDYAHSRRVIHRDIKPANVMVGPDGVVKVLDFGLAAQIQTSLSRVSQVKYGTSGTGPYMAPEQWRGQRQDGASDQYALAVVAYELLAGRLPFESADATVLRQAVLNSAPEPLTDVPPAVWGVLERGLAKERQQRFGSCAEFVAALEGKAADSRQQAENDVSPFRARRSGLRIPLAVAGGVALVLLLGLGGWYFGVERPRQRQAAERAKADAARRANAKGGLLLKTAPSGATVTLGSEEVQTSPAEFKGVKIGKYPLRVSLEGYEEENREVEIRENEFTDLGTFTLTRSTGSLKLDSAPEGAAYPTLEEPYENSLGMKFVPVAGTAVLFGVWDVRVRDYAAYAQANRGIVESWQDPGFPQEETHPVVNVSWEEAKAFCAWLTRKERAAGRIGAGQRYRLPTDAEWSAAVGLPTESGATPREKDEKIKGVYPWGREWPPPSGAGNYGESLKVDSYAFTSPVGSFKANQYGLYDMGGNVWQWCEDYYDGQSGSRVLRGASWFINYPDHLLSSNRLNVTPAIRDLNVGFRCVLEGGSSP